MERLGDVGWDHWLLVRRSLSDATDLAYYVAFGPAEATLEDLVQAAGMRWKIKEAIESAKEEAGRL